MSGGLSAAVIPMEVPSADAVISVTQVNVDAMITEPADPSLTSTVPPPVEQPTSDVRNAALETTEIAHEAAQQTAQQPDTHADPKLADALEPTQSNTADPMELSSPQPAQTPVDEPSALLQSELAPQELEPPVISENTAPAAQEPVTQDTEMASQPYDTFSSGQVHPRDEDDEAEPAAKRAKTDELTSSDQPAQFKAPVGSGSTESKGTVTGNGAAAHTSLAGLPPTPSFDSGPVSAAQKKAILDAVRRSKKIKAALPFLHPVDPVALNIPSYPEIVKNPMDLSTMEEKLRTDKYESADAAAADIDLIVQNAMSFNGAQHPVAQSGMNLRAHFLKIMTSLPKSDAPAPEKKKKLVAVPKPQPVRRESRYIAKSPTTTKAVEPHQPFVGPDGTPLIRRDSSTNNRPKREIHPPKNRDLPYTVRPKKKKAVAELKFCETVLDEILKRKNQTFTYPFLQPVDPVALNIPGYFKVVKKPMDLSTIKKNLQSGEIANAKDFHAAVKLMLDNCFKFNPSENDVHRMGKLVQELFERLWADKDQFLADQMRGSEPETPEADSDAEGEDEDDPAAPQNNRMMEIQKQIAALSQEAMMLSSGAPIPAPQDQLKPPKALGKKAGKANKAGAPPKLKRTSSTAAPAAAKPAKSTKKKSFKRLSLDQKRYVSEAIGQLSEAEMNRAVQIIRNGVPRLRNVHDDELELDIEEIPDDVVFTLYEFVSKLHPQEADVDDDDYEEPAMTAKPTAAAGRKKNKPMSAREQESKIAAVQRKLQQFNGSGSEEANEGSYDGSLLCPRVLANALAAQRADDSSDDAQSESSEEE